MGAGNPVKGEGDGSGGGDGGARGELSLVGGSKGPSPSPAPMDYIQLQCTGISQFGRLAQLLGLLVLGWPWSKSGQNDHGSED